MGFFGPDLIALEACASQPGLTLLGSGQLAPLHPSSVFVLRREAALLHPDAASAARAALAKSAHECHLLSQESSGWATLLGSEKPLPPFLLHTDYTSKISLRYVGRQLPGWQKTDTDFIFEKARLAFRSRGDFKDKITQLFIE
jgi:ABC-type nitrate/sulfonate/bicarbonate transport system substrate-binding protein